MLLMNLLLLRLLHWGLINRLGSWLWRRVTLPTALRSLRYLLLLRIKIGNCKGSTGRGLQHQPWRWWPRRRRGLISLLLLMNLLLL